MPTLAVQAVTAAPDASHGQPERWIVFLHGILGSGANWRTFARQVTAAKPEWGALLVDLRLHGESQGFAPPHTIAAAAQDVAVACADKKVAAVLGHSFGGKVAIECARTISLEQLFVVDSTPGARLDFRGSSGVRSIVELLRELPDDFADRQAFTQWAVERGVGRETAMWLAMNVRADAGGRFVFRIDVPSIRTMMEDYFKVDLWDVIESGKQQTHLIAGGKSEVLDAADLERARALPRCTADVIPAAGHWVHVDAPTELLELVLGFMEA